MVSGKSDLLDRYLNFSGESATIINKALSAVKPEIDRALADAPRARETLYRLNDVQLFLMQVTAFDGFVTQCMHAVGLERKARCGLVKRVDLLASEELRKERSYAALRSAVEKIVKVRNAWAHRLCDAEIAEDVRDLTDRFGLHEQDGYLWITLEHVSADGGKVWGFLVCTLHEMAKLIWPCVKARTARAERSEV